ncbi:MAG TPA: hypothetical protein VFI59_09990 [Actinomycetota bacterium]|nr:hypothetical protein [Actinomycetota bacterium]
MSLLAGLAVERGALLVGLAVVTGSLALVALADGTLRRVRARRSRLGAR